MLDLLSKLKFKWTPLDILPDSVSGEQQAARPIEEEDEEIIAQKLCDHLNMIMDFKDRIESIDYLAAQSLKNFENISYSTVDQNLINAIIDVGGKEGVVDFDLIKNVIEIMLVWYTSTAADSITAAHRGAI